MAFIMKQTNFLSGLSPINGFFNIMDENRKRVCQGNLIPLAEREQMPNL